MHFAIADTIQFTITCLLSNTAYSVVYYIIDLSIEATFRRSFARAVQ